MAHVIILTSQAFNGEEVIPGLGKQMAEVIFTTGRGGSRSNPRFGAECPWPEAQQVLIYGHSSRSGSMQTYVYVKRGSGITGLIAGRGRDHFFVDPVAVVFDSLEAKTCTLYIMKTLHGLSMAKTIGKQGANIKRTQQELVLTRIEVREITPFIRTELRHDVERDSWAVYARTFVQINEEEYPIDEWKNAGHAALETWETIPMPPTCDVAELAMGHHFAKLSPGLLKRKDPATVKRVTEYLQTTVLPWPNSPQMVAAFMAEVSELMVAAELPKVTGARLLTTGELELTLGNGTTLIPDPSAVNAHSGKDSYFSSVNDMLKLSYGTLVGKMIHPSHDFFHSAEFKIADANFAAAMEYYVLRPKREADAARKAAEEANRRILAALAREENGDEQIPIYGQHMVNDWGREVVKSGQMAMCHIWFADDGSIEKMEVRLTCNAELNRAIIIGPAELVPNDEGAFIVVPWRSDNVHVWVQAKDETWDVTAVYELHPIEKSRLAKYAKELEKQRKK